MAGLEDKYDVVIIGSGMGGLASALILAKEGYKVCVLEKEAQIGGTLQTFKREGSKFDTGVHYVGGLDPGQPLHPYYQYLGILDDVNLKKLDVDGYDLISFEGDPNYYPHAQGYDNFKQQLLKYFPNEEQGLDKYIEGIKDLCDKFALYNIGGEAPLGGELQYMNTGARDYVNSCTTDEKLRLVLSGSNLLYAGEGDTTPFYIHALVINSYILSSYKFVNGGSEISRSLNYSIKKLGGKIVRNAEVVSINHVNKEVENVELKDGRKVKGDIYISNLHPTQTLKLMDYSEMRKSYVKRILNLENSISIFTLYIILKPNVLKYFNHNHYHFKEENVWDLIHNHSNKDWGKDFALFNMPDKDNPKFAGVLTVMAYMSHDEVSQWSDTNNTIVAASDRGDGYKEFKQMKAELLLDEVSKIIPGLKSMIQSYYTSTPLTQRDYLNTVDGSLYGVVRDFKSPLKSQVNTKTKLKNLFLTGQNIIMHGLLGTTIGAVVTCSEIIGREKLVGDILDTIKEERKTV